MINEIQDDLGMNGHEIFNIGKRRYCSFFLVDENGDSAPMGLPVVFEIAEGKARRLGTKEAFDVLSKID